MKAHLIDTHLLIDWSKLMSNIKVMLLKRWVFGGIGVSQTHLVWACAIIFM